MIAKTSPESTRDSLQDALSHNRDLLLALSRAAQSIQRARTAEDFYQAVGNEVSSFGGEVTLLLVNEDRQSLTPVYTSFLPGLLRRIEKIAGISIKGYRIVFPPDTIYARVLAAGNAEYVHWTLKHINDALPVDLRPLAGQFIKILKIKQGILAPLRVDDETLGLMMISGVALNEDDLPAMESFAGQIAAGLQNIRLMQKLQNELTARKQVEDSLNHNRNLLLALSRAAQSIQLVHEPEEIYQVVGDQIKALGFEATILTFENAQKHLCHRYSTLPAGIIKAAEKLTGFSAKEYSWPVKPDSIYSQIIAKREAEYIPWAGDLFLETVPESLHALTGKLMKILGLEQGIIAPLDVDEETLGVLLVFGNPGLSREDLPAMDSFAGQVAISLRNTRLAKKIELELAERRQAEELLRASEAKQHALLDAIPDMMFMLTHEDIFFDYHASKESFLYAQSESFIGKNIRDVMPSSNG